MCDFLLHIPRYSIALNPVFTAYTFSPTFPNFLSSLPQMEPTPCQVSNHFPPKNQEAHLERALVFKKAANVHCRSSVCLPIICDHAMCWGWLMSLVSVLEQHDNTEQKIRNDESNDPGKFTLFSDIEEDNLDHQQKVLLLGKVRWDKSLRTARVPKQNKQHRADTVIACPLHPNYWNPAGAREPPLLKCRKSNVLIKLSESDHAPSNPALPLRKSSGDQNVPQPKASADQNVPQNQKATFEIPKIFKEAIIFTNTPWPILSNEKYWMVEEMWKPAIEAQDHQWALAGAPVGMPSVCQLPGSPSLKIDLQTQDVVTLEFCLMLLYQISDIDCAPNYA